jgi:hypothetical protein
MFQRDPFVNPIEYEILEEKAATLGRVAARMEATLAALAALEQEMADGPAPPEVVARRASLREEAAEWLWYVVVQREAMGMTSHHALFETYRVPPLLRRLMGPRRKSQR